MKTRVYELVKHLDENSALRVSTLRVEDCLILADVLRDEFLETSPAAQLDEHDRAHLTLRLAEMIFQGANQ